MDIAAGNGRSTGQAGIAPEADLLFVEISGSTLAYTCLPPGLGDSVRLVEAVGFLFDVAAARPCAVNISLGSNSGPQDGSSLEERMFDSLISAAPNRSITVSAGNSFSDIHSSGQLAAGGVVDLNWQLDDPLSDNAEVEVWYPGSDRFSVDVLSPDGQLRLTVPAGASRNLAVAGSSKTMANRLLDPNNDDDHIAVLIGAGAPGGRWKVRLHGVAVTGGTFHAWIERDDTDQSAFNAATPDNTYTLSSLATGRATIVAARIVHPMPCF